MDPTDDYVPNTLTPSVLCDDYYCLKNTIEFLSVSLCSVTGCGLNFRRDSQDVPKVKMACMRLLKTMCTLLLSPVTMLACQLSQADRSWQ